MEVSGISSIYPVLIKASPHYKKKETVTLKDPKIR
jgi:hypothetical protein